MAELEEAEHSMEVEEASVIPSPVIREPDGSFFVTRVRRFRDGQEEVQKQENERIKVQPFLSAPAYINLKYGQTISTAPFEGVRIDIGISLPAYPEEVPQTLAEMRDWLYKRLADEVKPVREKYGFPKKGK